MSIYIRLVIALQNRTTEIVNHDSVQKSNQLAKSMNENLITLRHELHKHPEISNREYKTAQQIVGFINQYHPDEVVELGKTGKAFVFNGKAKGKTLVFRAELDALPIAEQSGLEYASIHSNVAHSCGHDGHMAIVAGLASKIAKEPPQKGRVVLLFQPAEEIEQGAKDVLENPKFSRLNPDYMFALHNVPGVEKHKLLFRQGSFAAASKGMTVALKGKTSHAAEPEKGINPALAISKIVKELNDLISNKEQFADLSLLTFIYIRMGEISFGTSAGSAEMGITLRAFENKDMELLSLKSEEIIQRISKEEKLQCTLTYDEIFPATVNHNECVLLLQQVAEENNFTYEYLEKPFKWSEDFGYFSDKYKTGFFGLGSGIDQPPLHNPDFDFPDDIIKTGLAVFASLYQKINF